MDGAGVAVLVPVAVGGSSGGEVSGVRLAQCFTATALGIRSLRMDNHCTLTRWCERWCYALPTSRRWSTIVEPLAIKRLTGTISWTH